MTASAVEATALLAHEGAFRSGFDGLTKHGSIPLSRCVANIACARQGGSLLGGRALLSEKKTRVNKKIIRKTRGWKSRGMN
jgi:6-phosphofructokinase